MNGIIAGDATYVHADTDQFGQGDEQDGDHGQDQEGEGDEEDGDDDEDGGKKAGYRGRTWTDTEDVLLCEAWMNVIMCTTKGANQKRDAYWARIHMMCCPIAMPNRLKAGGASSRRSLPSFMVAMSKS